MLRKLTISVLSVMMLLIISVTYTHAQTITLDGIGNAVLWSEDKTSAYLNIYNVTDSSYYYEWKYDGSTSLAWGSLDALVADPNLGAFEWRLESGGDPFNTPSNAIWKSIYLTSGSYEISLSDNSEAYNLMDYWGGNMWNAYVQMWADYDDSFNFGDGLPSFSSESETLAYYRSNVDGMIVDLQEDTNLYFYINDTNSIDNSGSVTLNISPNPVPEPTTIVMLGLGIGLLAVWRYKQNKTRVPIRR
jgi:PEP-CTERM motif